MKQKLLAFSLVLVSVLAGLFAGEIILRIFKPQIFYLEFPDGMYRNDEETCYMPTPHSSADYETTEFRIPFHHNSLGLRDKEYGPKAPGDFRILALGDSFTWGVGALQEESWPKALERLLQKGGMQYEVINAGVPGYETRQEYYLLSKYGLSLKPDMVILAFVPNDITGGDGCRYHVNPDGKVVDAENRDVRVPKSRWLRFPRPFNSELFLRMNSHLYVFCKKAWKKISGTDKETEMAAAVYLSDSRKTKFEAMSVSYAYGIVFDYLERVRELCRREGIRFVLIAVPMWDQLGRDDRLGPRYSMRQPQRVLADWAKRQGVHFIDPVERFRSESTKQTLYWSIDQHLSRQGYQLLADEVYNYLLYNKLLVNPK